MSHNRKLASDIKEIDKGITECQNFLAKVLQNKTEISRQGSVNRKNVPAKSVSRAQSRRSQFTHQRAPSAGSSSVKGAAKSAPSSRKPIPTGSKQASPERQQTTRIADGQRRSSSASRLASQGCRCNASKQPNSKNLPTYVHSSCGPDVHQSQEPYGLKPDGSSRARSRSPDSRSKHLSWGEILLGNYAAAHKLDRSQWDIGRVLQTGTKSYPPPPQTYTTKLPHECEPIKECTSQSNECNGGPSCNHFFKISVTKRVPEESFSSEGTSGFSSNNDLPCNLTNKSIQCGSPIPQLKPKPSTTQQCDHRRVSSSSSGASSQKEEKEKVIEGRGSDAFSMFNPVRTLNFLIKELQGMIKKHPKEDGSISRIIADMEKVLVRLPEGGERAESSSGYTTHSKAHDCHSMCSSSLRSCNAAEKPMEGEVQKEAIMRAMHTVPALARRIDERIESMRRKIIDAKVNIPVPCFTLPAPEMYSDSVDNILRLQRYMENSGHQLEIMCQTMEHTCDALRKERDVLQGDLVEREKKLRVVKSQEQDFLTTVTSLRTNLETTTRRATQLSVENKFLKEQVKELPYLKNVEQKYKEVVEENRKLKEENEIIPALKAKAENVAGLKSELSSLQIENKSLEGTVAQNNEDMKKLRVEYRNPVGIAEATRRLTQRLQDTMKERDDAQHDAHMLRMEREKLLVMTQNKDEELSRFVKDILNIKKMVTDQLDVLKTNIRMSAPGSISALSSSSDSDEMNSVMPHCQPVCSSPTSRTSGDPHNDEVWRDISSILPDSVQSSPEIVLDGNDKPKDDVESPPTEFKSVGTWHSVGRVGQSQSCVLEDPLQPRTAVPRSQPPVGQNVANHEDNGWVGAATVTHELQQNVQELFEFCKGSFKEVPRSSEALTAARSSNVASSSGQSEVRGGRKTLFQMPKLPDPPKFLATPDFSDFSSYHESLADTSSVESIDLVLKELHKDKK